MKVEVNLLEQFETLQSGMAGTNGKPGNSGSEFAALLKQNMAAGKAVEKPVQVVHSPGEPDPVHFAPFNRPTEKEGSTAASMDPESVNMEEVMELIKPGGIMPGTVENKGSESFSSLRFATRMPDPGAGISAEKAELLKLIGKMEKPGDPLYSFDAPVDKSIRQTIIDAVIDGEKAAAGSAGKFGSFRHVDSDQELSAERAELLKLIGKMFETGQLKPETGKDAGPRPGSAVNLAELNRFSEPKNEVPAYDMEKLKAALEAFRAGGDNSEETGRSRFSLKPQHLSQGEGKDESGLKLGSVWETTAGRQGSGVDLPSRPSLGEENTSKTIKGLQLQGQEQDQFGGQASIRSSDVLKTGTTTATHLDNLRENVMQQVEGRLTYIRENSTLPAEMRLTLNPPELGEVTIRVFSKNGQLSASIITESALVKEILESSITELRQRLNFVNIQFEQLDISTSGEPEKGSDYSGDGQSGEGRSSDRSGDTAGSVPLENDQDISDGSTQQVAGDSDSGIDYWV